MKITEELIQAHTKALKDLGIDLEKEAKEALEKLQKSKSEKLDERMN